MRASADLPLRIGTRTIVLVLRPQSCCNAMQLQATIGNTDIRP
jgi:hypothetical protein